MVSFLLLVALYCVVPSASQANAALVYTAQLTSLGDSGVTGAVAVFPRGDGVVGYTGTISGLEVDLGPADCTATNGCGVHLHSGMGCESTEVQGGHYYADPIVSDPWLDERYDSDENGDALFGSFLNIGTQDLQGRAFVVHNQAGGRVACGLLNAVSDSSQYLTVQTTPLGDSGVEGIAEFYTDGSGTVMMVGSASGLENSLISAPAGEDCTATNGCGAHIHSGYSCANSAAQEGHLYDGDTFAVDPWLLIGYPSTTDSGEGEFIHTVITGVADMAGRAFVIHANDGSRVSCGLMERSLPTTGPSNIATIASGNEDFSTLVAVLSAADLAGALARDGPFTVFAPTNAAFNQIPPAILNALLNEPGLDTLAQILLYHVVPGIITADNIVSGDVGQAETLQGGSVVFDVDDMGVMVDDARVTGVDITASNGVIHVIDSVLIPSDLTLPSAPVEIASAGVAPPNIAAIASANDDFTTLVAALAASGLTVALTGDDPFTVFAPTNDAFDNIPADTLNTLLNEPGLETLTQILLYHVVPGIITADNIVSGDVRDAISLQGGSLLFYVNNMGVMVNDARVTAADIAASNGVIHIIDSVMIPPDLALPSEPVETASASVAPPTIAEIAVSNNDFTTLVDVLSATGLVDAVSEPGQFTVFAPTNAAFDAIPRSTLNALLSEPGLTTLTDILLYHVHPGIIMSTDLVGGLASAETLQGEPVRFSITNGAAMVNEARISTADIRASNGVIHVINRVLIPDGIEIPSPASNPSGFSFVVSMIEDDDEWCLTVTDTTDDASMGFRPCDFDSMPDEQMFAYQGGQFISKLDEDRCIQIGFGSGVSHGTRVRYGYCDNSATDFTYDPSTDFLQVAHDMSYCLSNRGPNPHVSDPIDVKMCEDEPDYRWMIHTP